MIILQPESKIARFVFQYENGRRNGIGQCFNAKYVSHVLSARVVNQLPLLLGAFRRFSQTLALNNRP